MKKLIVTLAVLWVLAPVAALAGGGDFPNQQEQRAMPQGKIVIENHVPADDGNGAIIAAVVAGAFTFAGVVYTTRRKRG